MYLEGRRREARELLDWGGAALRILNVVPVDPPTFEGGRGRFWTSTPVVVKGTGWDAAGERMTRQA
ncbi:hypothetical protein AB0K60_29340 [Thermopolyspora sp. NPDC052614]|uniref:hypothetical protein n=1 Tax=Thermopolyspora sp. NPDC052614 TaxID=3155682 RepID=UPI00343015E8